MIASKKFSDDYLNYISELISQLDRSHISQFVDHVLGVRDNKQTIFFLGNGGSASTASHFVNDISLGSRQFENPFRAVSLCDNQAVITAIANDDGYENIFLQQLQTQAKPGDSMVCISASGNSQNLVKAVEWSKANGIYTISLTAFDGGYLKKNCDISIHVDAMNYGISEDAHHILMHVMLQYLIYYLKKN